MCFWMKLEYVDVPRYVPLLSCAWSSVCDFAFAMATAASADLEASSYQFDVRVASSFAVIFKLRSAEYLLNLLRSCAALVLVLAVLTPAVFRRFTRTPASSSVKSEPSEASESSCGGVAGRLRMLVAFAPRFLKIGAATSAILSTSQWLVWYEERAMAQDMLC